LFEKSIKKYGPILNYRNIRSGKTFILYMKIANSNGLITNAREIGGSAFGKKIKLVSSGTPAFTEARFSIVNFSFPCLDSLERKTGCFAQRIYSRRFV